MSTIHDPQQEANTIQMEILQVERMITHLQDKRSSLLRKLNSLRPSTRNLPPETLSLVFEYCVVDDTPDLPFFSSPSSPLFGSSFLQKNNNRQLLVLRHVSAYWREVAWSTPCLWAYMSISDSVKNVPRMLGMLELHLRAVQHLPFNLNFEFPQRSDKGTNFTNLAQSIRNLLINEEHSRKIQHLQLKNVPKNWLESTLGKCHRLERLSLLGSGRGISLLNNLPQLRHVAICGPQNIQLRWITITTLDLAAVPIDHSANILPQCPNLVKFRSRHPQLSQQHTSPPSPPTTLHHLRDLHWTSRGSRWCLVAFQHNCLPALHTLTWNNNNASVGEIEDAIHSLFRNHQDTLQIARVYNICNWTLPFTKRIFSHAGSVQTLDLTFSDVPSICAIIRALCPGADGGGEEFLPSLSELTIATSGYSSRGAPNSDLRAEFSSLVVGICRARRLVPGFKLTFRFSQFGVNWAPGVLEELREMISEGFNLCIEDSSGIRMGKESHLVSRFPELEL